MNELKHAYMEVVEKYTLDGANTFALMKHKHKGYTHEWHLEGCVTLETWKLMEGCEGPRVI